MLAIFRLFLLSFILMGCQHQTPDVRSHRVETSERVLVQRGERALSENEYREAVGHFEMAQSMYPFGRYAKQTQRNLMYAYFKDKQMALAVAAADRYIHLYPRSRDVAYAYYIRGVANFDRNRSLALRFLPLEIAERDLSSLHLAYSDFHTLVRRFSSSKYTADAKQRMIYLRNLFATYELATAKYYLARKNYVAAANRASYLIEEYAQAPQVKEALQVLQEAYTELKMPRRARDARRLLAKNYPHG